MFPFVALFAILALSNFFFFVIALLLGIQAELTGWGMKAKGMMSFWSGFSIGMFPFIGFIAMIIAIWPAGSSNFDSIKAMYP
jgi:hypothetical protein